MLPTLSLQYGCNLDVIVCNKTFIFFFKANQGDLQMGYIVTYVYIFSICIYKIHTV